MSTELVIAWWQHSKGQGREPYWKNVHFLNGVMHG